MCGELSLAEPKMEKDVCTSKVTVLDSKLNAAT